MSKLVITAFGIHKGGGLVLLEALMRAAHGRIRQAFIDTRVLARIEELVSPEVLVRVPSTIPARLSALRAASRVARAEDRLLCFNSLPPLTRSLARTIVYVHTPHMAGQSAFAYSWKIKARHWAESSLFWVQTPTMADALASRVNGRKIQVVPFVDDALASTVSRSRMLVRTAEQFIYPADGVAHKNHINLFRAWALLDSENIRPKLDLTLKPSEFYSRLDEAGLNPTSLPHVKAERLATHEQVLAKMRAADALIFPSRAETFGLPLIEATMLNVPILAAEASFVRDVCIPAQTFDPGDPRSIADAVLRFIGRPRPTVQPLSAQRFVERLFAA